jgi:hypothetical protein
MRIGKGYQVRNAKAALRQSLKGRLDYLELPKIYLGGFAEYDTLNRLRDESGYFFRSRTPDVYAAVALSLALDKYVYLREPLSICGASAHSIGSSEFNWSTNSSAIQTFYAEQDIPFLYFQATSNKSWGVRRVFRALSSRLFGRTRRQPYSGSRKLLNLINRL